MKVTAIVYHDTQVFQHNDFQDQPTLIQDSEWSGQQQQYKAKANKMLICTIINYYHNPHHQCSRFPCAGLTMQHMHTWQNFLVDCSNELHYFIQMFFFSVSSKSVSGIQSSCLIARNKDKHVPIPLDSKFFFQSSFGKRSETL